MRYALLGLWNWCLLGAQSRGSYVMLEPCKEAQDRHLMQWNARPALGKNWESA